MISKPLVSVIILNWNGKRFIEDCLKSVTETNYYHLEIIVVDNCSTDGSDKIVEGKFPNIKLIKIHKNLGFGGGNNIGIRSSMGKYIVLLNYDTLVDPNWLTELVKVAEDDPLIGLAGCKIYFHNTNIIQHAGGRIDETDCRCSHYGYNEEERGIYNHAKDVDYVTGAALMFSRACLHKIGLFDPLYFMYYEEVELALRARRQGFRVVYVPSAVIYHYENAGFGGRTKRYNALNTRNRFRFLIKNYGISKFGICFLGEFYRRWFIGLRYEESQRIIIEMFFWNVLHLFETLNSRTNIIKLD